MLNSKPVSNDLNHMPLFTRKGDFMDLWCKIIVSNLLQILYLWRKKEQNKFVK